jgi:hypothetical protein
MTTKTCTKCHTPYPATAEFFSPDRRHRDGLHSWCRECSRAKTARWSKAHPGANRAAVARYNTRHPDTRRAWRAANPGAAQAHNAAYRAVKMGRLTRPNACEQCGQPSSRLEKHHADYSRPLDVIFACSGCHKAIHRAAVEGLDRAKATATGERKVGGA